MRCPHCNRNVQLPDNVTLNMESYGKACKVAAPCCGRALIAYPKFSYTIAAYTGAQTEDDWGTPFKQ